MLSILRNKQLNVISLLLLNGIPENILIEKIYLELPQDLCIKFLFLFALKLSSCIKKLQCKKSHTMRLPLSRETIYLLVIYEDNLKKETRCSFTSSQFRLCIPLQPSRQHKSKKGATNFNVTEYLIESKTNMNYPISFT